MLSSVLADLSQSAAQWFSWENISSALPVIISLIIIEGLLSVDNALAIAAMAKHLPPEQQKKALKYGLIGAYVFRGICMALAAWIINNPWLKIVGAAYLMHLMASHFSNQENEDGDDDPDGGGKARGFWMTVFTIEILDLTLSVDNVVAAVAIDPRLWVVCCGVFIGILALRFLAGYCIRIINRFPILEHTAFLLIGFVGAILLVELTTGFKITALYKFYGIAIITGLSLLYEHRPVPAGGSLDPTPVQKSVAPLFAVLAWPMKLYSAVTGTILWAAFVPFRYLIALAKK